MDQNLVKYVYLKDSKRNLLETVEFIDPDKARIAALLSICADNEYRIEDIVDLTDGCIDLIVSAPCDCGSMNTTWLCNCGQWICQDCEETHDCVEA